MNQKKGFAPIIIALIVLILAGVGGVSYYYINNSAKKTEEIQQSYIKLVSPNGGEQWEINKTYNIIWKSQNVDKVSIYLSQKDGSDVTKIIVTGLPASSGEYFWTIPSDIKDINMGGQFLINISADENSKLYDKSDNSFSIAPLIENKDSSNVITTIKAAFYLKNSFDLINKSFSVVEDKFGGKIVKISVSDATKFYYQTGDAKGNIITSYITFSEFAAERSSNNFDGNYIPGGMGETIKGLLMNDGSIRAEEIFWGVQ